MLIETYDTPIEFIEALVKKVYEAKGYPLLDQKYARLIRAMMKGASKESLAAIRDAELHRMKNMDAFKPVRMMPNFGGILRDKDMKSVAAYVATFK